MLENVAPRGPFNIIRPSMNHILQPCTPSLRISLPIPWRNRKAAATIPLQALTCLLAPDALPSGSVPTGYGQSPDPSADCPWSVQLRSHPLNPVQSVLHHYQPVRRTAARSGRQAPGRPARRTGRSAGRPSRSAGSPSLGPAP
jgi:hypothetical protein